MSIAPFLASPVPILSAIGALGVITLWAGRWPRLALVLLGASVIAGQLGRLPLPGQGGGLLISDFTVPLVLLAALWHGQRNCGMVYLALGLVLPFLLWSLFSLAINAADLSLPAIGLAVAYWVRLSSQLLLLPALLALASRETSRQLMRQLLWLIPICLAILGMLQLLIVPSLEGIGRGWDPHSYRLVATWLDPNFIGGLFAIMIPVVLATAWASWQWSALAVIVSALLLTQSRSSLVTLLIGCLFASPLVLILIARRTYPTTLIIRLASLGSLLGMVVILAGLLLGNRAGGLFTFDPTVTLRLNALTEVWQLAAEHSGLGVGYNAYQFAAMQAGLIGDFTVHSRAGADNSWLTLWVTTGIVGIVLWLLPWSWVAGRLARRVWYQHDRVALAGLMALVIWVVHSQLVNSLLYGHLLIVVMMLLGVILTKPEVRHD